MSEIKEILERKVSATTISFHLRKLREAGLVTTNGHKKGFKAVKKALRIEFNGEGLKVKEEK
jgi:DNA-binding transcriptional ArsR family regulator